MRFFRGVRNALLPSLVLWVLLLWSVGAFAQSGGQTTRPTWFNGATQLYVSTANPFPVSGTLTLGAGSAILGKVGIDQTTPGTTNGVQVNAALPAGTNTIGTVNLSSQYPSGATAATNSATGTTGATTATLAAVSAKNTYLCGFTITSDATAALAGTSTVTGTIGGTMSFIQNVGSATAAGILTQAFSPCIPSSAVNTAIAVISVAAGTGGNTAVTAWGYQL